MDLAVIIVAFVFAIIMIKVIRSALERAHWLPKMPSATPSPDGDIESIRSLCPEGGQGIDDDTIRILYANALKLVDFHWLAIQRLNSEEDVKKFVASLEGSGGVNGAVYAARSEIANHRFKLNGNANAIIA